MIVAVGGIELNSKLGAIKFFWHAMKSLKAAKVSVGCVHAEIFRDGDVFFALSVWQTAEDMAAYGRSKEHANAMRKTKGIVHSAVNHHYEAETVPYRAEAVAAWRAALG